MAWLPTLLLSFLLLSPSLCQQQAHLGHCQDWEALTDGFYLTGSAMTSIELLEGLPDQTRTYLGIKGDIEYNGTVIEGSFPAFVYTNQCDDDEGGEIFQFEEGGEESEENEIWLSFRGSPNEVEVTNSQLADYRKVKSVIIHAPGEGGELVKALCCSFDYNSFDTDEGEEESSAGRREILGWLVGIVGVLWFGLFVYAF